MDGESIGRTHLATLISELSIEQFYDFLEYDYAAEIAFQREHRVEDPHRARFLARIRWRRSPQHVDVLRLFNQANSAYAEAAAAASLAIAPLELVNVLNRLVLYRQGKPIGYRDAPVSFGARSELPQGDVFKQFKVFWGCRPDLIHDAMVAWDRAAAAASPTERSAIAVAMAFVAIHPFSDGNGRIGRFVFSWLLKRFGFPVTWLAEDELGEFRRTGSGIDSTEYLMRSFFIELCGGHCRVDISDAGRPDWVAGERAHEAMLSNLAELHASNGRIITSKALVDLQQHLLANGHLLASSPRLNCLEHIIEN